MWQRNNGRKENEVLQNHFTSYISTAIKRRRNEYIHQMARKQMVECLMEDVVLESSEWDYHLEQEFFGKLPLMTQLKNDALFYALKEINERERHVFLSHVLDEKNFEILAKELGLTYKGVAAIYYRAVQKIRKRMGGFGK
ncbi:sigma-70 family RNA polymerase sigma factor [Lachnoclostridium edouardi]|uniref:sigma-70 family RNA polymerase sigma factor n=1 Tax=Lachnoclostridium edouardi TaxID=1926283 RepID=UPI000C7A94D8|nr:sigma-70 family RNA polymerase sigma factor [Lachnoclostridium edouardi]